MTDYKHTRPYFESLRRIGAQNPGDLDLRTPIQAVAILDDLTHLVPPEPVPVIACHAEIAAGGAGFYARIELMVQGCQGIWLINPVTDSSLALWSLWTLPGPSGLAGSIVPGATASLFGDGRASTCRFDFGVTAAVWPVNCMQWQMGADDPFWKTAMGRIYIAPNRVLVLQCRAQNSQQDLGFIWQEIPLGGP